jgi:predicted nucleic acid-binding protein
VNLILSKVKDSCFVLTRSPVHEAEIQAINDDLERVELLRLLEKYGKSLSFKPDDMKQRIETLISLRFGIADAAHISFAQHYGAIFITCDDKLLKQCHKHIKHIPCYNPVTFCEVENLK